MPHARIPGEEIDRRREGWYENSLRRKVETSENLSKQIVINVETGEYEIDDSGLEAGLQLLSRRPGAALYGKRIGYDAVFAIGRTLSRTAKQ